MIRREDVSDRGFRGYGEWATEFVVFVWASAILGTVLSARSDERVLDPTTLLLIRPLAGILLVGAFTFIVGWSLRTRVAAVLQSMRPWFPILLIAPFVDVGAKSLGIMTGGMWINGGQALAALLSGGLFFAPFPVSVRVIWLIAICFVARMIHRAKPVWKNSLATFFALYVSLPLISSVPSVLAWISLPSSVRFWSVHPQVMERALVYSQTQAYWWSNVFERFPFALAGEAQTSTVWFLGALAFLGVSLLAWTVLQSALKWSVRSWLDFFDARTWVPSIVPFLFGGSIAISRAETYAYGWVWGVALCVLCISALWSAVSSTAESDLLELRTGSDRSAIRPLALGRISSQALTEWGRIANVLSCVGMWFLGWPMFLLHLLLCVPIPDRLKTYRPAFKAVVFFLTGWVFIARQGNFQGLPLTVFLGTIVIISALFLAENDRLMPRIRQWIVPASLLLFPLIAWSRLWAIVAVPVAFLPWARRGMIFGWKVERFTFLLFFACSALFVASGWLVV